MSQAKKDKAQGRALGANLARVRAALLSAAIMAAIVPGMGHAASATRTSAFEYDAATGVLTKEIVEPTDSNLCVVTTYTYDSFGNKTGSAVRNCNGSAGSSPGVNSEAAAPAAGTSAVFAQRSGTVTYSADGRFATQSTNALTQSEKQTYDARFGAVTSQTGPNNLTTSWLYGAFGRKLLEKRADGNGTRVDYLYCNNVVVGGTAGTESCPTVGAGVAVYVIKTTPVKAPIDLVANTDGGANGPYTKSYYDAKGRVIRQETQGYDGSGTSTLVYQDTEYDARGQKLRTTRPYFQNASAVYSTLYTYDKLERLIKETAPDTSKTTTAYQGLTVTVTNDLGNSMTEVRNVGGLLTQVIDANGKTLNKAYDPHGNLVLTTDAQGNQVKLIYDLKGRKTQMQDPDLGTWTYEYDALGQLVKQTDAKQQVTQMGYDVLGRLVSKTEPSLNTTWTYDKNQDGSPCAMGVGKLCEARSSNGYARRHAFDSLGRPSSTIVALGAKTYTSNLTYDAFSRVSTVTYPGGSVALSNVYTSLGYLQGVVNAANTSVVYWRSMEVDAEGHVTKQQYGNGVSTQNVYDPATGRLTQSVAGPNYNGVVQNIQYAYSTIGNLSGRADALTGVTSVYAYDKLNRLTGEQTTGGGLSSPRIIQWTYDDIGNITSRSDVGTYVYPASGANSVRPHATIGIVGTVNGRTNVQYAYDDNGNLLGSAVGQTVTRNVAWNSFNKVQTLQQRMLDNAINQLDYLYDSEGNRAQEVYTKNGATQRTTVYLNPGNGGGLFYEEETTPSGNKKKYFINAGGTTIGVAILTNDTTWSFQYWHKDHLGSNMVLTNEAGTVVERMAYEPFGKRRNADGSTDANGTLTSAADRGFTGHEMMDEVGLINMNGRIYDPAIGRFLSADPYIQSPDNLQSYNRYAYVWNNPLNATDPTGYWSLAKFVKATVHFAFAPTLKNAFNLVRASPLGEQSSRFIMKNQWAYAIGQMVAGYYGGPLGAAAWSSYFAYYQTGSMSAAYRSGAISLATAAAFNWAGNVGQTYGAVAHFAAHAAVGCVSAAAQGGKCGQGAVAQAISLGVTEGTQGIFGNNVAAHFSATVVAGGLSSQVMGGSFKNGATTAAYGYLFNFLQHATFDRSKGTLEVIDEGGKRVTGKFFSGTGPDDQIAPGEYAILQRGDKDGFRLEAIDSVIGDDRNPQGQELLRLHGPGRSFGCITACDGSNWAEVRSLIANTAPKPLTVNTYRSVTLPGGHLLYRHQTGTETLNYYGNLTVK